jgi:hypothetical protein
VLSELRTRSGPKGRVTVPHSFCRLLRLGELKEAYQAEDDHCLVFKAV